MSERDLVTGNVVLDALKAVEGISPIPGGSGGRNDVVLLQHDGKTLAHAIARPLNGSRPHSVRLRFLVVPSSELPDPVRGNLRIEGTEGVVIVDEANVAQGVKLIEYLVAQQRLSTPAGAKPQFEQASRERPADESTFDHFKPKSSAEYTAHVAAGTFKRTRQHEALIKAYGEWARANEFKASTAEHPKDLVLRRDGVEWMLEGEVLRGGNAAHAVREAIGQLLEYRRFLYTDAGKPAPILVGLFSEDIGEAYLALLEELGILAVWRDGLEWRGCEAARTAGLTSV